MDFITPGAGKKPSLSLRARHLLWHLISVLPDRPYLAIKYASIIGRFPDLKHPRRFTEKLQTRKIEDRNALYPSLVDKAEVKRYIAESAGERYVIPTLWVGTDLSEVDWDTIPLPAVVKPTHASAHGYFLRTPSDIEKLMAERPEESWLALRHDRVNREWAYKDLTPRIIIEKMLGDGGRPLTDYRLFAFNGEVVHIELRFRKEEGIYEYTYSPDWKRLPVRTGDYLYSTEEAPKPARLAEMLDVARKLSRGISFMRVDLYASDDWIYAGELTLYPAGGFETYQPEDYDLHLGREWERCNA